MAKKKFRTDNIPDKDWTEDWAGSATNSSPSASDETNLLPYSGEAVQKFIKENLKDHDTNKIGYIAPMEKDIDGYYHIRGFANRDCYTEWISSPEDYSDLKLVDVTIPISDEQGVMNIVELTTASDQKNFVSVDGTVILKMRFTSQAYNPVTQKYTNTYEDGTMTIQRRSSANDTWRTIGTMTIKSVDGESEDYTDVDISGLLNSGTCQLRVIVTGDQTQAATTYVVFQSVTKTELVLTFRNEWQTPVTGSTMSLLFTYSGAIAKTLNLQISGEGGTRTVKYSLGKTEYTETPNQFDIVDSDKDDVKVLTHGVHEITAWLSVDGTQHTSSRVQAQLMVVAEEANKTPYIIINNINSSLINWTTTQFFQWAVYNPASTTMPVTFTLTDLKGEEDYLTYTEQQAKNDTVYTFSNMIEINSKSTSFSAYMTFMSGNTQLRDKITFSVDNSQNFAPTDGADLIINPKLRSNTEIEPATIINTVSGATVPAKFYNFGFISDGWVTDSDGIKCLRVPSGRSVEIDYETFSDFIQTRKTGSLTFEIDYAIHNATDTEAPVLRMCSYTEDGKPLGWEMKAMYGCFMTANKSVDLDQNVGYREGVRTRVAVNLLYNLSSSGQNYCRIFINGIINREFNYDTTDTFVQYVNGVQTSQGIRIGCDGADIDIYSIKVYKKALTAADIRQNYMAALDSNSEKIAFRDANDILDGSVISYDRAYDKYNVMLWKGKYATYGNTKSDKFNGNLVIHIQGDPEHSGTLYNMNEKGQGTSSMLYYWWNGQWGFNSDGYWEDENGVNHGACYQLTDDVPAATKLVGKVNFASSMQSHKIGSTALYNDLWKEVCGGNTITETKGFENTRSAVLELPFLLFIQENEDQEPQFASFITFGPGKGDKPTFGYDKKVFPDYICIEGSDNDRDVVMGRAPWIDEDVILDDENWMYNGEKQFALVFGDTAKYTPFKDAFNFIYQHYDNIDYYDGTIEELQKDSNADTSKHYWLTTSGDYNEQFDLFRYDFITSQWVGAGLEKIEEGRYSTMNVSQQCGKITSSTDWNAINDAFKTARTALFKDKIGNYFNLTELQFHINFTKMIAASDNRGKNIYFYVDPGTGLIGWHQDDLDTIFNIDNVGKNKKPYYVEEHDLDENGSCYWNSESNSLFNQMENAFASELRVNMRSILQAMTSLSDDGTLMGCMEKYYFYVQQYFPAVAYNEVARIVYEKARMAYVSTGSDKYTNGTDPITQSLGDQLQAERQWVERRMAYLSSYAGFGDFGRRDGEGAAGSLNFRSIVKIDGTRPSYTFSIVPHIWMYPTFAIGSTLMYGIGNSVSPRVKEGEQYDVRIGTADGNTNIFLNGIDYMRTIGDFTDKSLGDTFNLSGARLTKFYVDGASDVQFRPTSMSVTAALLQELVVRKVSTLIGGLDLSALTKLRLLDLTGTSLSQVTLPATEYLTEARLPATLTSLTLDEQPNLSKITLEGASRLQSLTIGSGISDGKAIFDMCYNNDAPLNYLYMTDIDWSGVSLYVVNYLASITNSRVTGKLALTNTVVHRPSFSDKLNWMYHWGNIDDPTNNLQISYYKTEIADFSISGDLYVYETTDYTYQCIPNNTNANDVVSIEWSITENSYAVVAGSSRDTCTLRVNKLGDEDTLAPTATLTCVLTKTDGKTITRTLEIGLYPRRAHLGDYVFYDGTWGDQLIGKTVVGVCCYVNVTDPTDRRMLGKEHLGSMAWGLRQSTNPSIVLESNPNYSVYDIPTITNISTQGISGNVSTETLRDETTVDGFRAFEATTYEGDGIGFIGLTNTGKDTMTEALELYNDYYKAGDEIPVGLAKTLRIIQHRNTILSDGAVDLVIPKATDSVTEMSSLNTIMSGITVSNDKLYYYPAASYCYAYEPGVKTTETLHPKFKAHNWYLPSSGELCRVYWLTSNGSEIDDTIGIFNVAINAGCGFASFTKSYYWSSTEQAIDGAGMLFFANGQKYIGIQKNSSYGVRPMCKF
jgi:hypothetical protein